MRKTLLATTLTGLLLVPGLQSIAQEKPKIIISSGEMQNPKGKDKEDIVTAASGTTEPILLDELVATYNDTEKIDYIIITSNEVTRTKDRAQVINEKNAHAYLELHYLSANTITREFSVEKLAISGYAIHYAQGDKDALLLAQYIGIGLRNNKFYPTKFYRKHEPKIPHAQGTFEIDKHSIPNEFLGIYERVDSYQGNNVSIKHLQDIIIPALRIDCGFVDTKEEETTVLSQDYQKRFKAGIQEGIELWLKRGE